VVYAIVEAPDAAGGIFRSADRGVTWEKRNPFSAQAQYYSHLVVDPVNKDRLYVMNVFIQVSDDGGKTLAPLGRSGSTSTTTRSGSTRRTRSTTSWGATAASTRATTGPPTGTTSRTSR
jgi:hypothetical protein